MLAFTLPLCRGEGLREPVTLVDALNGALAVGNELGLRSDEALGAELNDEDKDCGGDGVALPHCEPDAEGWSLTELLGVAVEMPDCVAHVEADGDIAPEPESHAE